MNLIDKNLVFRINKFINEMNNNKSKEIKAKKSSNKKLSEKFMNILNNIPLYKQLNKKQRSQVEENIPKELVSILSKSITNMTNFLIKHNLIIDIINYYVANFELGIEAYYYFESLLNIKFQKHYLKLNPTKEHLNEKYGNSLNKEQILLINIAKFLPKENYIQLFQLNKSMYSIIRKYLI
jgi:Mlc titration factor MtfA (ptsG expression regulator)